MRAGDIAIQQDILDADDDASMAARLISDPTKRAALVVDATGNCVGVLTDSGLLRYLLPSYLLESQSLAGTLEEGAAEDLWSRLRGKTVAEILQPKGTLPIVSASANLIEVAMVMVNSGSSLVGVTDRGRLIGGISLPALLSHLLGSR